MLASFPMQVAIYAKVWEVLIIPAELEQRNIVSLLTGCLAPVAQVSTARYKIMLDTRPDKAVCYLMAKGGTWGLGL